MRKIAVLAIFMTLLAGCSKGPVTEINMKYNGKLSGVAVAGNQVWTVGEEAGKGKVYSYDGKWKLEKTTDQALYGVSVCDNRVWAVGRFGKVLTYDGKWNVEKLDMTGNLRGVNALDEGHVWAVGDAGTIYFNDGTRWVKQETPIRWNVKGVSALDPEHVWAVGAGGILFFDGQRWSLQYEVEGKGDFTGLNGVVAVDGTHVWACGTTDGGNSASILFNDGTKWKEVFRSDSVKPLKAICACDGEHVYAVADFSFLRLDKGWMVEKMADEELAGVSVGNDVWAVGHTEEYQNVKDSAIDRPVAIREPL